MPEWRYEVGRLHRDGLTAGPCQGEPPNGDPADDALDLASLGYRQSLDRRLGGFSSFAAGFSYISILTGVFQMFHVGWAAAGPAFFWTWPVVLLGQASIALCLAELAARFPLSGGVYPWARRIAGPAWGWATGWVALGCGIVSLAAVALALQTTLPQVAPWFQFVGDGGDDSANAKNAVILGCSLIVASTLVNLAGVRVLASINNLGVVIELVGVSVLIALLALRIKHGPAVLLEVRPASRTVSSLAALLAASLASSYVLYGFDTAGSLAEETVSPRLCAPRAILRALLAAGVAGGLLILFGLLSAADPLDPALGRIGGGLPYLVKGALGPALGVPLLTAAVLAVCVCALAVQGGAARLVFAMARDGGLPFSGWLARVPEGTKAPAGPVLIVGVAAAGMLAANINFPKVIETVCAVAVVWANLAYLMTTGAQLLGRLRGREPGDAVSEGFFSMGRWGLMVNLAAVVWGVFVVVNTGWPRGEGQAAIERWFASLATLSLIGVGILYHGVTRRGRIGVLAEHVAAGATAGLSQGDS